MPTPTDEKDTAALDAVRRDAMAFAGIGWFAFTFEGRVVAMDDGAFRLFDLAGAYADPAAVVGAQLTDLVRYTSEGYLRAEIRRAGRVRGLEWQFTTRIGIERWVVQDAYLVPDADKGEPVIQVVLRDVSEARQAQQALRRAESWLWAASEGSHDVFYVLRAVRGGDGTIGDFVFEELNQRAEAYFGMERDLLLGQQLCVLFPDFRDRGMADRYAQVVETRMFLEEELPLPTRDGTERWVREQVLALADGVAVTSKDITQRRRMEEALRASEQRLRLLLEHTPAAVAMLDRDLRYIAHSPRWLADFALPPGSLVGREHLEVFSPPDERWRVILHRCLSGESVRADAERLVRPDGVAEWVRYEALPWGEDGDAVDGVVLFMEVITGRVLAERRLRDSEERLRLALRGARMGTWEWNIESGEVAWSAELEALCGLAPGSFAGTYAAFEALVHPEDRAGLRAAVGEALADSQANTTAYNVEHRMVRPDGATIWLEAIGELSRDAAGRPLRLLGVSRDITRRRVAEAERHAMDRQLQHTQRLESLGVLAGGIAHDFNNLLTGVLGNVELLRATADSSPATARRLNNITHSARRAAELCRQMLAYAGRGEVQICRTNLNTLVSEMAELLEVTRPKKARFLRELAPDLPDLVCDPAQVCQVIMNLVSNAAEALGDDSGHIHLRTGVVDVGARGFLDAQVNAAEAPGTFVFVEVCDSGPGIDEAALPRIFEPFYTTKFAGRGLGLASVLGIVSGHRGALRVTRPEGGGTCFTVHLPACLEGQAHAAPGDGSPAVRPARTVLLIDDEESIRGVMAEYLGAMGCAVTTASDGVEGLQRFMEQADAIDIIVLDRTMPRMSGDEAFREIRAVRPDVPVVLTSGYTDDDLGTQFPGLDAYVQKPYQGSELFARIEAVLTAPRSR